MTPPSAEHYAELAALFTTVPDAPIKPSLELLLPAHLPVQGGLWLVPYAGREADGGTVMLVRMHEDTVDVAAIGMGEFELQGCNSMEDVLGRVSGQQIHWIVQPPVDADPTSLLHCDADKVTLLSGADQAAVVGAYRLLKGLIASAGEDTHTPSIRLVVVGAEERASADAANRIVQTAELQLGVTVEVGPALPAMGSTSNVISQVSFSRESNVVDLLGRIRNADIEEVQMPTTERHAQAMPEQMTPEEVLAPEEVVAPEKVIAPEEVFAQVRPAKINEEPVHEPAKHEGVEYASHVDGLLSIAPRCPVHEHVELAVDTNGCLHVLADANDFRDAAIVSAWIVRHRSLISMACGGLKLDAALAPVQHLFTDDAVVVADLHGTGVRMHLLTEVQVEGNTGTYCTPLN